MAVDISSFISPVLSAVFTAFATYALLRERLAIVETKLDLLKEDVNKYSNYEARLGIIENNDKTMWRRIDENRDSISALRKEFESRAA